MKKHLQIVEGVLLFACLLFGPCAIRLYGQNPENPFGTSQTDAMALRGDIYFLPEGTSALPDFSRLSPVGTIYTKVLNIPGRPFTSGFPGVTSRFEWFAIRYTGTFSVRLSGDYNLRLVSDDGSKLLIDGQLVINNDGVHPESSVSGRVYLGTGQHRIEVQYFQGPRDYIALQLFWTPPGGTETTAAPEYVPTTPTTPATPATPATAGITNVNCGCNPTLDLTGIWNCDDGGTYYLRQIGCTLWWSGELRPDKPSWANVAHGTIFDRTLIVEYADVPKGAATGCGVLILQVISGSEIQVREKIGNYGGSRWWRR